MIHRVLLYFSFLVNFKIRVYYAVILCINKLLLCGYIRFLKFVIIYVIILIGYQSYPKSDYTQCLNNFNLSYIRALETQP